MPTDVPERSRYERVLAMWEPYFRPRMVDGKHETGRWYWFVLLPNPCPMLGERIKFRSRADAEGFWQDYEMTHALHTQVMQSLTERVLDERDQIGAERRTHAIDAPPARDEEASDAE